VHSASLQWQGFNLVVLALERQLLLASPMDIPQSVHAEAFGAQFTLHVP